MQTVPRRALPAVSQWVVAFSAFPGALFSFFLLPFVLFSHSQQASELARLPSQRTRITKRLPLEIFLRRRPTSLELSLLELFNNFYQPFWKEFSYTIYFRMKCRTNPTLTIISVITVCTSKNNLPTLYPEGFVITMHMRP